MILRERINDEILRSDYECVVCYENITPKSPVWSCSACYRVIDLKCVKKWAERDNSDENMFKCPHCRVLQRRKTTNVYRCWCKKEVLKVRNENTKSKKIISPVPHSCGQTCGAKRDCPHPCPLACHPGPHVDSAECMHIGPQISCFCKKTSEQVICSETKYGGFSCGSRCGLRNPVCGHRCSLKCHKASPNSHGHSRERCGECTKQVQVICKCGKVDGTRVPCSSLTNNQRKSLKQRTNSIQISCGGTCNKPLDCGIHLCSLVCHKDDEHKCPFKPYEDERCFCGKSLANRKVCDDPKPSCGLACNKKLECGHRCQSVCHDSVCPPCCEIIEDVPCRCARSTQTAVCGDLQVERPQCDKKCGATLICGRHHCRRLCCEFNPSAYFKMQAQRRSICNLQARLISSPGSLRTSSSKKKRNRLRRDPSEIEPEALSDESLAEKLAEYDLEISKLDSLLETAREYHSCMSLCNRMLSCKAHSCVLPCHSGPCPPCHSTSFEEWQCPCGLTKVLPPIRCGTVMPDCTKDCHRPQPCGHRATHMCHTDAEDCLPCTKIVDKTCTCGKDTIKVYCSATNVRCRKRCGKTLACGHKCEQLCCGDSEECPPCSQQCTMTFDGCNHQHNAPCHYPAPCPLECTKQFTASCPCGCLTLFYDCGEAMEIACNEVCLKEAYPPELLAAFEVERDWLTRLETKVAQFARSQQRTIWLSPMNSHHRSLTHLLFSHYNMKSESMDSGPMRSVRGIRTPETRIPKFTLRGAPRKSPQLAIPRVVWQLNARHDETAKESWLTSLLAKDDLPEAEDTQSGSVPVQEDFSSPMHVTERKETKPVNLAKKSGNQQQSFGFMLLSDES